MSRRTSAFLVAGGLLVALWLAALFVPSPYVVMSPGPTVNLLGKNDGQNYVEVSGTRAYRDKGALRLLTVVSTGPNDHVSIIEAFSAWLRPGYSVYRYQDLYRPTDTAETVKEDAAVDMTNSQDTATALALHRLGKQFQQHVQVLGVVKDGPSDGILKVHDVFLKINGKPVATSDDVVKQIQAVPPKTPVKLRIERSGKVEQVSVTTTQSAADPTKSAIMVSVGVGYDFPYDIKVDLGQDIGGPSAGMMFAAAIYDTLTPGSLTGGKSVAGTGTVDVWGNVGGIGGIQQKLAGAQAAGAKLFLAPGGNCAEVLAADYDHDQMRVLRVDTFDQAITDIETWRDDPNAPLPECVK